MLHGKFQNQRPYSSEEEDLKKNAIYSHGGHLGHVTLTIYINFQFLFLRVSPGASFIKVFKTRFCPWNCPRTV